MRALEKMFPETSVCVQCHRRITEGGYMSKAHGYELILCSMGCGEAYWNEYDQFKRDPTRTRYQQGKLLHTRVHSQFVSGGKCSAISLAVFYCVTYGIWQ